MNEKRLRPGTLVWVKMHQERPEQLGVVMADRQQIGQEYAVDIVFLGCAELTFTRLLSDAGIFSEVRSWSVEDEATA